MTQILTRREIQRRLSLKAKKQTNCNTITNLFALPRLKEQKMGYSHLQELSISYKDHQIFTLYSDCTKIYLVLLVFPCYISETHLLILIDSFYSIG